MIFAGTIALILHLSLSGEAVVGGTKPVGRAHLGWEVVRAAPSPLEDAPGLRGRHQPNRRDLPVEGQFENLRLPKSLSAPLPNYGKADEVVRPVPPARN